MNLRDLKTEEQLKSLVIEELGYRAVSPRAVALPKDQGFAANAKVLAEYEGFEIIFIQVENAENNRLTDFRMRAAQRDAVESVEKYRREQCLLVVASADGEMWHFVNPRSSGARIDLRRFSISPHNRSRLRTASDQLRLIKVDEKDTLQSIIEKHRIAFDVEAVTMQFFRTFAGKFLELMGHIKASRYRYDQKDISDVAQIILNRIVFLKFIEQKGWLDGDGDYLFQRFQPYYKKTAGSFWLNVLIPLFDLLSNPERTQRQTLGNIPFLNGGLFGAEPDDLLLVNVPNDFFLDLFEDLLNRFNFTIEESSPTAVEVAVDPEMLGRIFEELVLRLEKVIERPESDFHKELRRETGSYYTPRVAVFSMCREAIARRSAEISGVSIATIKQIIDLSLDEMPDVDQLNEVTLSTSEINGLLRAVESLSICDPAVGSGAFLLGALQILTGIRRFLLMKLDKSREHQRNFDYSLKEDIIRRNLVGVDLLRQAVHICELRLWLSLAVDYETDGNTDIPTLPNLTYKIFWGDSIVDHLYGEPLDGFRTIADLRHTDAMRQKLEKIVHLKNGYFHEVDDKKKQKINRQIAEERLRLTIDMLESEAPSAEQTSFLKQPTQIKAILKNIDREGKQQTVAHLKRLVKAKKYEDVTSGALSFTWMIDLAEYFVDHGTSGFDIVLGNPPYGVKNEAMIKGKERYRLGNKDSYGVFIAMAIVDLLKDNGVLSFITSDTWQTIKTHRPLRRLMLDHTNIHQIIMMPSWLFGATVYTSIVTVTKVRRGRAVAAFGGSGDAMKFEHARASGGDDILVCDFTRVEKHTNDLEEELYALDDPTFNSTPKRACYRYQQGLIETNSNIPLFVGSPKLFALMNDTSTPTEERTVGDGADAKTVRVRQIEMNGKIVEVVRFGDLADVRKGIDTGENHKFLFQNPDAHGSYRSIADHQQFLLTDADLANIRGNEALLSKVIEKGLHKSRGEKPFDENLWFDGRYIAPYDKGGESDTKSGWLPNYWVPTEYYIDWSKEAVSALFGAKHAKGHRATLRNKAYWFKPGLSFSLTGHYAPTFRVNNAGMFDNKSSGIFSVIPNYACLAVLCSKLAKFIMKNYIMHTIDTQVGVANEFVFSLSSSGRFLEIVDRVIQKQKRNPRYDYMSNEQKEIDRLVYELYGLDEGDIHEVETWYARRYQKLAQYCDV